MQLLSSLQSLDYIKTHAPNAYAILIAPALMWSVLAVSVVFIVVGAIGIWKDRTERKSMVQTTMKRGGSVAGIEQRSRRTESPERKPF